MIQARVWPNYEIEVSGSLGCCDNAVYTSLVQPDTMNHMLFHHIV